MRQFIICLLVASFTTIGVEAQQNHRSFSTESFFNSKSQFDNQIEGDFWFVLLAFEELPSGQLIKDLENADFELLEYKGGLKFYSRVPVTASKKLFNKFGITSVQALPFTSKLSPAVQALDAPSWAKSNSNRSNIVVLCRSVMNTDLFHLKLTAANIDVAEIQHISGDLYSIDVKDKDISKLAKIPFIQHIDYIQEMDQKLNYENRNTQRVNFLNNGAFGFDTLNGDGIVIGVGDGGELGEHIDFSGRIINEADGTYSNYGQHGDHVSGIIGAAGNLNSRNRGVASECTIVSEKTSQIVFNTPTYFHKYNMMLANSSYGVSHSCTTGGSYNYSSQLLDNQIYSFPNLLHVFAAGNSGNETCDPYPKGYKTVLKFYQSAKNVLTVGNVNENRVIASSSAKGPVLDGRIKPEICGVGNGVVSTGNNNNYFVSAGTSMAAPSVTGTLGLLYELYHNINGQNPSSSLIKAVACNTADDQGREGPDYQYGFGTINARRAALAIQNVQYFEAEISHGEQKIHNITIPSDVKQLKIMLYWHDYPANPYAPITLVNNLDLEVQSSNGNTSYPLILNPAAEYVEAAAVEGVDNLNNIEQVVVNNPSMGNFTIKVAGTEIPFGNQAYTISYEYVMEEIVLTYPVGNEGLIPESTTAIQWDAEQGNESPFEIQYSNDNGISWESIATGILPEKRFYNWSVPAESSDQGLIKIIKLNDNSSSQNENTFSIMELVQNVTALPICEDNVELNWDTHELATNFEVLTLIGEKMTSIGMTNETSFIAPYNNKNGEKAWYSVCPVGPNGGRSLPTFAIDVLPENGVICPWANDLKIESNIDEKIIGRQHCSNALSSSQPISVDLKNIGNNTINEVSFSVQKNEVTFNEVKNIQINSGESETVLLDNLLDISTPGTYSLDIEANVSGDTHLSNNNITNSIRYLQLPNPKVNFPIEEPFDFMETKTFIENDYGFDSNQKWDFYSGSNGMLKLDAEAQSLLMHSFDNTLPSTDQPHVIMTLNLEDFSHVTSDVELSFKTKLFNVEELLSLALSNNQVSVRGSDTDPWVLLTNVDINEDWTTMSELEIHTVLENAGQDFSASTQIKFDAVDGGYYIDEVILNQEFVGDLPLDLVQFAVTKKGENALVKWRTENEINTHYFEIEVAKGKNALSKNEFVSIGKVEAQGANTIANNYSFLDEEFDKKGMRFYRLKQVDNDLSTTYSEIKELTFIASQYEVVVMPNPFDQELLLDIQSNEDFDLEIILFDSNGREVFGAAARVEKGVEQKHFVIERPLVTGMYYLVLKNSMGSKSFSIVKNI